MNEDLPELEIGQKFRIKSGDARFLFELHRITINNGSHFELTGVVVELSGSDFIDADGRVIRDASALSDGPRRLSSGMQP